MLPIYYKELEMENSIIDNFKRLKDEMEQKGYTKQQQLGVLIPMYENILDSMQDLLKSQKDDYDDLVAKFQFLRAIDRVDAKDKERYYQIERYKKNTIRFLFTKSKETADGLNEILQSCINEDK